MEIHPFADGIERVRSRKKPLLDCDYSGLYAIEGQVLIPFACPGHERGAHQKSCFSGTCSSKSTSQVRCKSSFRINSRSSQVKVRSPNEILPPNKRTTPTGKPGQRCHAAKNISGFPAWGTHLGVYPFRFSGYPLFELINLFWPEIAFSILYFLSAPFAGCPLCAWALEPSASDLYTSRSQCRKK